ncbi:COX15/CtaA family protein [Nakamurella deserti]|uniref:COX15/CtaA family protein n=1 Tax=Nakamurella deserti TaxID=2164074 RepID=UPI000DBE907E|nr:COX15/CtaA family protein [Nakamurella deserti]
MAVRDAPPIPRTTGLDGWRPSHRLQRGFALAAVITNAAIAVTGAVVRVTGSGLGCPTWPECHPGSLVPVIREENSTFHQLIEFGNRTLTGVVLVASLGTFLLIWRARPRRRSLVWLAAALPALVLFQAVWGGITVLFGLAWWTVAPHMLFSLGLLSVAVWVHQRLGETGDGPVVATVPRPLHLLAWATCGVLLLLCVVGTLVTAAGPHAGDSATARLDLSVRGLAQVHADLMFTYLGLLVAFGVALVAINAPAVLRRRMWVLVGVTLAQGALGIVQYQLGVPEVLVVLHVTGAVLLVTAAVRMLFATRTRTAATPA